MRANIVTYSIIACIYVYMYNGKLSIENDDKDDDNNDVSDGQ